MSENKVIAPVCSLCGEPIAKDPLPIQNGAKFVHPHEPACKEAMQSEIARLRVALTSIREWSVNLREEYLAGDRVMTIVAGVNSTRVSARDVLDGPVGVLLSVTGQCSRALRIGEPK